MGITEKDVRQKLDPLIGKTLPAQRVRTIALTRLAIAAQAGDERVTVEGRRTHEARDWHVVVGDGTSDAEYPHQMPDAEMEVEVLEEPVPASPGDLDADPPVEPTAAGPGKYRTTVQLLDPLAKAHAVGEAVRIQSGWAPENYGPDTIVIEPSRRGGMRRPVVVPVKAFAEAYKDAPALSVTGLKTANAAKITAAKAQRETRLATDPNAAVEPEPQHGPICDRVFDEWKARGVLT